MAATSIPTGYIATLADPRQGTPALNRIKIAAEGAQRVRLAGSLL